VSVIRIEPPLIITESELEMGLSALEAAMATTASYVRGLPQGALGSPRLEATFEVTVSPDVLFSSLCDLDYLYSNSPIIASHRALGPDRVSCEGRVDDISIQWDDVISVVPERREIEQRASEGFWQGFTRHWTVKPGPGMQSSLLTFRMEWDVGTGGFERVLSLRLRYSLEKAMNETLSHLRSPAVVA
jgi:putrescine aminotransferase